MLIFVPTKRLGLLRISEEFEAAGIDITELGRPAHVVGQREGHAYTLEDHAYTQGVIATRAVGLPVATSVEAAHANAADAAVTHAHEVAVAIELTEDLMSNPSPPGPRVPETSGGAHAFMTS